MTNTIFRLQSHKFSTDNIQTTLVCSKCDEVFSKEFPLDLEGQTIEFKCPVCNSAGEADLPYKSAEEREELEEDFDEVEEEDGEKNLRKIIDMEQQNYYCLFLTDWIYLIHKSPFENF